MKSHASPPLLFLCCLVLHITHSHTHTHYPPHPRTQGVGCLILFEPQQTDKTYPRALEVVANMSAVVDTLYDVATKIDA